jgi:protein involved in polysaccharide export with SLBB domain
MNAARLPLLVLALVFGLGFTGCATDGTPVAATNPRIPETASSAVLRPGDSLTVVLQGIPDPSTNSVQIDDQGLISLPFIGSTKAAGVSTSELSRSIRAEYLNRRFYTAIDVSVSIAERFIYVGGEVARPGRVVWTPDLTASKAIQAAGGFSLYAKENAVNLTRDSHSYPIDINLAQRRPSEDPRLLPGDSLQVSRSAF